MTNWPTKKLEEICNFQNGLWKAKKEPVKLVEVLRNTNFKNNDGSLNYDDVAEIEVEKKQLESRLLQKGDIILERSGGGPDQPVGRVVYFENEDGKFSFSNFTTRIRVSGNNLDSKYLWFFLHSFYKSGKTEPMQKKTTGIRNLTFSEYKNIEISLPSLPEQKKIVAKLERVLGKISEAKKLRAEAQEAAQNLLPAELHKIFEKGKKDYDLEELGNMVTLVRGPFGGSLKKEIFVINGDCVYEQGNVIDSDLENFRYYITQEKFEEMKRFAVSTGDILMSCSGTIGRFVIIPSKFKKGIINQALLKITPSQKVIAEFLKYALEDYLVLNNMHVKGMAIKNIAAVKELKKIKIPLPPLIEQKKIVARLDSLSQKIQAVKELQNTTENEFNLLERSLLSKAFSGKITS